MKTASTDALRAAISALIAESGISLAPDEELPGFGTSPYATIYEEFDPEAGDGCPTRQARVRFAWNPASDFRLLIAERQEFERTPAASPVHRAWYEVRVMPDPLGSLCRIAEGRTYPDPAREGDPERNNRYHGPRPKFNESMHLTDAQVLERVRACLDFFQPYWRRQQVRTAVLKWFVTRGLATRPSMGCLTLTPKAAWPERKAMAAFDFGDGAREDQLITRIGFGIYEPGQTKWGIGTGGRAAFLVAFFHNPHALISWSAAYECHVWHGQSHPEVRTAACRDVNDVLDTLEPCYAFYRGLPEKP